MADFKIYTPENAPEGSKELLQGFQDKLGFNANLFGLMAGAPAALKTYPAINGVFEQTTFSAEEKQLILIAVSVENECKFCVAAHSTIAKGQTALGDDNVAALRENRDLPDAKLNALARFTRKVTATRGNQSEADLQAFLDTGYTEENVLEVMIGVALKTFTNYINHLIDTPVNDEFAAESWDPAQKQAA